MKKRYKSFIAFSILLILLCYSCKLNATTSTKRYTIDKITITAEILPDGSLLIEEKRSYNFRGSFSWAEYNLPLNKLGRVTDFTLTEQGITYHRKPGKEPGTYQLRQDNKKLSVKWFYRAKNESRTFTLKYRVEDAVTVYQDVAEFYYKFAYVGRKMPRKVDLVDVMLKLPQPADTNHVRAWAHGPLEGQLAFEDGNIHLWVSPLPRRNYWEVRTIFPPQWVPSATKHEELLMQEQIMNEEKQWVEEVNAKRIEAKRRLAFKREHQTEAVQASVILSIFGFAVLILLYQRYGRAHLVRFQNKISSEIPENISPAVANYVFYSGQLGAGALVSTVLDLAHRGFLKIEESKIQKRSLFGTRQKTVYTLKLISDTYEQDKNKLAIHELDMIDFIFNKLSSGSQRIQLDEIKKSRNSFIKWFKNWKEVVKQQWGNRSFYDKLSIKGTIISALISVVIISVGVLIAIYFGIPGIIAIISGTILLGLSFIILRYTKEAKLIKKRLAALKKYLTKYHFRQEVSDFQSHFEKHLIYGVALGIGSKVMKELLSTVPEWQSVSWYVGSVAYSSQAGFAEAVTSMVTVASSTMGSAAGVGGGASAGGGAGAGGASGGAG